MSRDKFSSFGLNCRLVVGPVGVARGFDCRRPGQADHLGVAVLAGKIPTTYKGYRGQDRTEMNTGVTEDTRVFQSSTARALRSTSSRANVRGRRYNQSKRGWVRDATSVSVRSGLAPFTSSNGRPNSAAAATAEFLALPAYLSLSLSDR